MFESAGGIILAILVLVGIPLIVWGLVQMINGTVVLIRDALLPFKDLSAATDEEEVRHFRWNNDDREAAREMLSIFLVPLFFGGVIFLIANWLHL